MARSGEEKLWFLNPPSSFVCKIILWQRPQNYTSPCQKSLLVVLWHGRTRRRCGRRLQLGGMEIKDLKLREAGFCLCHCLLNIYRRLCQHVGASARSRASTVLCISRHVPSSLRAGYSELQHISLDLAWINPSWYRPTEKRSPRCMENQPCWFLHHWRWKPWLKSQAKFGPMLIRDKKITSAPGMSVSVLVWLDTDTS